MISPGPLASMETFCTGKNVGLQVRRKVSDVMKKMTGFLVWSLVFLLVLLAADQLLVHVKLEGKGLTAVQTFYLDFRSRLFALVDGQPAPSVESLIKQAETPPTKPAGPPAAEKSPRYLYVDRDGELHFAESLQEVPAEFRQEAQALSE